jgi:N-acetylglucosamine kinase-like BadF-type ATPase
LQLFLGVDGGQSSTKALIGDETGTILGAGTAGPCNHVGAAEGAEKLKRTVTECVNRACQRAGLDAASVRFRSSCFGMSGGPHDKERLLSEILRTERLAVTDDAAIALAGALAGAPGIVTIAGTGSIAYGRNASERRARAGGWGYIFGDEGSAFDIVRQALRAAVRHEEGWGPATGLREMLLERTGARDANAVLHLFYTTEWPRARVATLAPEVDRVAKEGDSPAVEILNIAAGQLASLAGAVRVRLWAPGETVRTSFIGGVFRSSLLLERFRTLVCGTAAPLLDSAAGALLQAYQAAGVTPDPAKLLSSNLQHGDTLDSGSRSQR